MREVVVLMEEKENLQNQESGREHEEILGHKSRSSSSAKKDVWDKLAAIGPIISGVAIFSLGGYFTFAYNQQQLRIQEVQTIEKFLPRLASDEQSKRAAILAISSLTNTELASRMAAIYASPGTASALRSIAQTGNEKDKTIATEALAQTLEKIAINQSKLKDMEQDLKTALAERDAAHGNQSAESQDLPYNLSKLAHLYVMQGEYDLAEPLFKRSLAMREQMYGPYNAQIVDVLKSLAELSKLRGNKAQSENYLARAQAIEQKLVCEEQPAKKSPLAHQNSFPLPEAEAAKTASAENSHEATPANPPNARGFADGKSVCNPTAKDESKNTIEPEAVKHGLSSLLESNDDKRL